MSENETLIVTPWHNPIQRDQFLKAWRIEASDPRLILQQDEHRAGCAATKNAGIKKAIERGARTIIVLDDDCYPSDEAPHLSDLMEAHLEELEPQGVEMFSAVTEPQSRGTPYYDRKLTLPVACSMGFWDGVPDFDAPSQLAGAPGSIRFRRRAIYGRYFALSGMNIAFHATWWPWCQFIEVPRFDDIWMGLLWQKHAYARGYCFSTNGPTVRHARQSNVWSNLREEVEWMEANETVWRKIHECPASDYHGLRSVLPV